MTIGLTDSHNDSLTNPIAPGAAVQYSVNGSADISSNTRQVTIAPGVSVDLLTGDPGNPVTITVGQNDTNLGSALSNFVNAYNAAATAIQGQTGQNAGPLQGQSIVFTMQQVLSSISLYSAGSGKVNTLAQLGLQVDSTGQMSFNASTFASVNPNDINTFLGGITTGGFLQTANNSVDSLTDPTTGDFETSINSLQNQINSENADITNKTAAVNLLQQNLMSQLSAADAAIATLQSQVSFFQQLFQTENASNFAKG